MVFLKLLCGLCAQKQHKGLGKGIDKIGIAGGSFFSKSFSLFLVILN